MFDSVASHLGQPVLSALARRSCRQPPATTSVYHVTKLVVGGRVLAGVERSSQEVTKRLAQKWRPAHTGLGSRAVLHRVRPTSPCCCQVALGGAAADIAARHYSSHEDRGQVAGLDGGGKNKGAGSIREGFVALERSDAAAAADCNRVEHDVPRWSFGCGTGVNSPVVCGEGEDVSSACDACRPPEAVLDLW
jgi:hypothetical protein